MRRYLLIATAALLALFVMTAAAADISGTWRGKIPAKGQATDQTYVFTVQGTSLTGAITTGKSVVPIQNGVVNGDKVSFTAIIHIGGTPTQVVDNGTVVGNEIRFTHARDGGTTRDFIARRVG